MKQVIKLFAILALIVIVSSCSKEDHVCYHFEVHNATETPMTVNISSWGSYIMYINGVYNSKYKFHEVETIKPHSSLTFSIEVGDNPDPVGIPSSLTPAWEYITAIECDGVSIPKEYFANPENWESSFAALISGKFKSITLCISPELIEQFR